MDETVITHSKLKTASDYKNATEQCLEEMKRLQKRIDQEDAEIERLKRETRAMLAQMKAA